MHCPMWHRKWHWP